MKYKSKKRKYEDDIISKLLLAHTCVCIYIFLFLFALGLSQIFLSVPTMWKLIYIEERGESEAAKRGKIP